MWTTWPSVLSPISGNSQQVRGQTKDLAECPRSGHSSSSLYNSHYHLPGIATTTANLHLIVIYQLHSTSDPPFRLSRTVRHTWFLNRYRRQTFLVLLHLFGIAYVTTFDLLELLEPFVPGWRVIYFPSLHHRHAISLLIHWFTVKLAINITLHYITSLQVCWTPRLVAAGFWLLFPKSVLHATLLGVDVSDTLSTAAYVNRLLMQVNQRLYLLRYIVGDTLYSISELVLWHLCTCACELSGFIFATSFFRSVRQKWCNDGSLQIVRYFGMKKKQCFHFTKKCQCF